MAKTKNQFNPLSIFYDSDFELMQYLDKMSNLDIFEIVTEEFTKVSSRSDEEREPYTMLSMAAYFGKHEFLEIVWNRIKDDYPESFKWKTKIGGHSLAHLAAVKNDIDNSKTLILLMKIMGRQAFSEKDNDGRTPFDLFVKYDEPIVILKAIDLMETDFSSVIDEDGNTPLHQAMISKNCRSVDVFSKILPHDAINIKNKKGETALDIAVGANDLKLVQEMLANGIDFNISPQDLEWAKEGRIYYASAVFADGLYNGEKLPFKCSDYAYKRGTMKEYCKRIASKILKSGLPLKQSDIYKKYFKDQQGLVPQEFAQDIINELSNLQLAFIHEGLPLPANLSLSIDLQTKFLEKMLSGYKSTYSSCLKNLTEAHELSPSDYIANSIKLLETSLEQLFVHEASLISMLNDISPMPLHLLLEKYQGAEWELATETLEFYKDLYPNLSKTIAKFIVNDITPEEKKGLIEEVKSNAGVYISTWLTDDTAAISGNISEENAMTVWQLINTLNQLKEHACLPEFLKFKLEKCATVSYEIFVKKLHDDNLFDLFKACGFGDLINDHTEIDLSGNMPIIAPVAVDDVIPNTPLAGGDSTDSA